MNNALATYSTLEVAVAALLHLTKPMVSHTHMCIFHLHEGIHGKLYAQTVPKQKRSMRAMPTSGWIRNEGDKTGGCGGRRLGGRLLVAEAEAEAGEAQIRLPWLARCWLVDRSMPQRPRWQMPCLQEADMPGGTRAIERRSLRATGRRDRCELWQWQEAGAQARREGSAATARASRDLLI